MLLPKLNFPEYTFRLRKTTMGKHQIFDRVRKKFVDLTPEEWVRQHLIVFLFEEHQFPLSAFSVEKGLKLNNTYKRTDIVIYAKTGKPLVLVECKEPNVQLDESVLQQSLRYNLIHDAPYILISNGLQHFAMQINENKKSRILTLLPNYHDIE